MGENDALPILLRELRERASFTLREVSVLTGGAVSNSYLSQLEQGHRPSPNPRILTELAKVYRISVERLFEAAGYVDAPDPSEIDRAYEQVLADPKLRFGDRGPKDLSQDAKRMFVELYEQTTGKHLLNMDPGEA